MLRTNVGKQPFQLIHSVAATIKRRLLAVDILLSLNRIRPSAQDRLFKMCDASLDLLNLELDTILTGADCAQVFKHQIFHILSHRKTSIFPIVAARQFKRLPARAQANKLGSILRSSAVYPPPAT